MISLLSVVRKKDNTNEHEQLFYPFSVKTLSQTNQVNVDLPQENLGLCLGFFDGFHMAHQTLVQHLLEACLEENLCPALFTFDDKPKNQQGSIQSLTQRLKTFEKAGIAYTFIQHFDHYFKSLNPSDFIEQILIKNMKVKLIVVGYDFVFGKNGQGTVQDLEQICQKYAVRCILVPPVYYGGKIVHSQDLRLLLNEGKLEETCAFMGRPYVLQGEVKTGQQLGSKLQFPTANVELNQEDNLLPYGVYYSYTKVGKVRYYSISNLGLRPSIHENQKRLLLETFIYDFKQDLYGQTIEVELLKFVRPEQKFENLEALKKQVWKDKEDGLVWHQNRKESYFKAQIGDIEVYHLPSTDFVTQYFNIELAFPYEKEKHASRQVLFEYLTSLNAGFENTLAFNRHLESFYGAALDLKYKRSKGQIIYQLYGQALRKAPDGQASFDLLLEETLNCLLYPKRDTQGFFVKNIYEKELDNFRQSFEERKNHLEYFIQEQSFKYLYQKLKEHLAPKYHPVLEAYLSTEEPQDYAHFTEEGLEAAYHEALALSTIKVYVTGALNTHHFEKIFSKLALFPQNLRRQSFSTRYNLPLSPLRLSQMPKTYKEIQLEQSQSYIHLFYKVDFDLASPENFYMNFFHLLLAGDTYAVLFKTLREEKHWCYHVGSEYHASLGLLHIQVSVLKGKEQACIQEIERQLDRLKSGKIEPYAFEQMKKSVLTEILSLQDQMLENLFRASTFYAMGKHPMPLKVLYDFVEHLRIEDFSHIKLPIYPILTYCGQGVQFES